jgi:hypothetical protein
LGSGSLSSPQADSNSTATIVNVNTNLKKRLQLTIMFNSSDFQSNIVTRHEQPFKMYLVKMGLNQAVIPAPDGEKILAMGMAHTNCALIGSRFLDQFGAEVICDQATLLHISSF